MGVTPIHTAELFFIIFGLLVCSFAETTYAEVRTRPEYSSNPNKPSSTEIKPLSAKIFPAKIIDLLSPEIFSQPDPVRYLLEKFIDKPFNEVQNIQHQLELFTTYYPEKFPSDYLPYAYVVWNLLNCRCRLDSVKKIIDKLRSSSELPYSSPPAGLFSPELNELFTPDIFSDNKPPFRLILKLATTPQDKTNAVRIEFINLYLEGKLPDRYRKYSAELWPFLAIHFNVKWLVDRVAELRDAISRKLPKPE